MGQICGVLGVPRKGGELLALQTSELAFAKCRPLTLTWSPMVLVVGRLGGTVPIAQEPINRANRNERVKKGRDARHACFEELGRLVGLVGGRVRELNTLDKGTCLSSS